MNLFVHLISTCEKDGKYTVSLDNVVKVYIVTVKAQYTLFL